MSEVLERRYRKLLRMLPKHYRDARGEELLGTFLERAEQGRPEGGGEPRTERGDPDAREAGRKERRWPEVREALSLAGLSLRVRFTGTGAAGGERASQFGATARAVALIGSAVLAVTGISALVMVKMLHHTLFAGFPEVYRTPAGSYDVRYSVLEALHLELPALWLVVHVLLLAGRWTAARLAAVGLCGFAALTGASTIVFIRGQLPLAAITTIAILAARGPATRRVGGRWTLPALAVPTFAAGILAVGMVRPDVWVNGDPDRTGPKLFRHLSPELWLAPDTRSAMILTGASAVAVLALAFRSAVWPVAVAVLGSAVFVTVAAQDQLWLFAPNVRTGDKSVAAAVEGVLLVTAGFALLWERRSARSGQPAPAG